MLEVFINGELKKVLALLFDFFYDPALKEQLLVGQNFKFDLRMLLANLNLPYIDRPAWDIRAGCLALDENLLGLNSELKRSGGNSDVKALGLYFIAENYGCSFYRNEKFSKEDSASIKDKELSEDILNYASMDSQILHGIRKCQLDWASREHWVEGPNYKEAYDKLMRWQVSANIHMYAIMEHSGINLDGAYLTRMVSKGSPFKKLIDEEVRELCTMPAAHKAAEAILKEAGVQSKGFFNKKQVVSKFDITTNAHKQMLFIKVLGLEPVAYGKDGVTPKLDADFQEKLAAVPEVAKFTRIGKLRKIFDTYLKGFLKKLASDPDAKTTSRIYPQFNPDTVTGRGNSFSPSLQQMPSRSKEAPIVNRALAAALGYLFLEPDYSAHEVRLWGFASGDGLLIKLFVKGWKLRKKYRQTGDPQIKERADTEGDIHKINVTFFFVVPFSKVTKELRDQVKSLVFGTIYGMALTTLAHNLGKPLKEIIQLHKKFFGRYKIAGNYLDLCVERGRKFLYSFGPQGRKRRLFGHLAEIGNLSTALDRRAKNAPIQGVASDIGHECAYRSKIEISKVLIDVLKRYKPEDGEVFNSNMLVHDSIRMEIRYEDYLIALQIYQWYALTGVRKFYKEKFGFNMPIPLEIEFKIGPSGGQMFKWSWHEAHLEECVDNALKAQLEVYPNLDIKDAKKKIYACRKDKKLMKYLDKNYPWFDDRPI